MGEFAKYILNEEDLISKIEIIYFLAPKLEIKFDKSIVFKTEIARMFLKYTNLEIDSNLILTANLLCNCKKVDDAQKIGKLTTYATEGAKCLEKLGFDEKFCKICEGVNRYNNQKTREPESDIIELVDQFGGMLIDRPERVGFNPDEALVLIEHRNLREEYNSYLPIFKEFVNAMEKIEIHGAVNTTVFARLQKLMRETKTIAEFTEKIATEYSPKVDEKIEELCGSEVIAKKQINRALFSQESEERILKNIRS